MSTKKPRAAIYARVSVDDGKTASISTQVQQCKEFAKKLDVQVVAVLDKDANISGGIAPRVRPSGRELYALRDAGWS